MDRLLLSLIVATLLSGCEALMPTTEDIAWAEAGLYNHRTDVGGYHRYDKGGVEVIPPWSR